VAGNLGPLRRGAGEAAAPEAVQRAAFAEQAKLLADAGADLLLIETMVDLDEARWAVAAAATAGLPVVCCMTFGVDDAGAPVSYSRCGSPPERCAAALVEAGADAVGVNCLVRAEAMAVLVRALAGATRAPVVARPSAGQPQPRTGGGFDYAETPEAFAAGAVRLLAHGARGLGGCCGTTPAHLAALRAALDAQRD
jgi:methionine synthase I (cobalamin-dependent)